jgi:hypothetical protein
MRHELNWNYCDVKHAVCFSLGSQMIGLLTGSVTPMLRRVGDESSRRRGWQASRGTVRGPLCDLACIRPFFWCVTRLCALVPFSSKHASAIVSLAGPSIGPCKDERHHDRGKE